jgi:hypothetical protein
MVGFIEVLGGFFTVAVVVGLLATIFWLWMLIDCLVNPRLPSTEKLIWVLVILFLHVLGALIYFFVGRGPSAGRM